MRDWIWLALLMALFGMSLLVVVPARTMPRFFLALAATELGVFFAVLALGLVVIGFSESLTGWLGAAFGLAAAILFLSPEVRSWRFRQHLGIRAGKVREERIEVPGGHVDCCFLPGTEKRPLIYVVHGGGWKGGSSRECAGFLRKLARMGYFVASGSYRFSQVAIWPAQSDDVRAGLRVVLEREEVDADRVYLLGRSAGGQVASAVACTPGGITIRGCIVFYAPFDMHLAYTCGREDDGLRSLTLLRDLLGGDPQAAFGNYHSASAFHLASKETPPFLLFHGTRDELVWPIHSRGFSVRLRELGVPCTYLELPWATHAFDHISFGPGSRVALAAIRDFVV